MYINLKKIHNFLSTPDTPKEVGLCLLEGLQAWYEHRDPLPFRTIVPHGFQLLQLAWEDQTWIGWGQFTRGYISLRWRELLNTKSQFRQIQGQPKVKLKYRTPETWGAAFLELIWSQTIATWSNRNESVHTMYTLRGTTRITEQLIQVAEHETLDSENLPYNDREWLDKTTDDFRKMPVNSLRQWVKNIKGLKRWFKRSPNHAEDQRRLRERAGQIER